MGPPEPRVVVITHYKTMASSVSVWMKSGWDEMEDGLKAMRELVCVGTREHCLAVAAVIESNLNLNRKGETK